MFIHNFKKSTLFGTLKYKRILNHSSWEHSQLTFTLEYRLSDVRCYTRPSSTDVARVAVPLPQFCGAQRKAPRPVTPTNAAKERGGSVRNNTDLTQ
jgi:hypothetical protein